jgi:hypothetical protein
VLTEADSCPLVLIDIATDISGKCANSDIDGQVVEENVADSDGDEFPVLAEGSDSDDN